MVVFLWDEGMLKANMKSTRIVEIIFWNYLYCLFRAYDMLSLRKKKKNFSSSRTDSVNQTNRLWEQPSNTAFAEPAMSGAAAHNVVNMEIDFL